MSALVVVLLLICAAVEPSVGQSDGGPSRGEEMQALKDSWFNSGLERLNISDKEAAWFYGMGSPRTDEEMAARDNEKENEEEGDEGEWRKRPVNNNPNMSTRKEVRLLSSDERDRFQAALTAMRTTIVDQAMGRSQYDIFVLYHRQCMSPAAHFGQAFLPWHREFLWRFERTLKSHQPDAFIPYWDSQLDQALPEPRDSQLWSEDLLGNNIGDVTSGFAADWDVIPECAVLFGGNPKLQRKASANPRGGTLLFSQQKVDDVLGEETFSDVGCEACEFELDHGTVHLFVGGQMGTIPCSPSDVIFWMHHAYIDCVWEVFRRNHQVTDPTSDYPNVGKPEHRPYAPMRPFDFFMNIHGLSNHYTDYYYTCAPRPSSFYCYSDNQCNSRFLFCHNHCCLSKVKPEGNCTGLPDRACFGKSYRCKNNKCIKKGKFIFPHGKKIHMP